MFLFSLGVGFWIHLYILGVVIMENYVLFLLDGQPLINNASEICLQNADDNSIHFVKMNPEICEIIRSEFPHINIPCVSEDALCTSTPSASTSGDTSSSTVQTQGEKHWSREATLYLIELRKQYDDKFKSTIFKNDQVWQMVSQDMHSQRFYFNKVQCRDKWQYLKKRYMKKRDNAGPRGTGEERITFEFFAEVDELLGKKHNVDPPVVASSLKGIIAATPKDTSNLNVLEEIEEDERPLKRSKMTIKKKDVQNTSQAFIAQIKEDTAAREINRERRHKEILEARNRAVNMFATKMDDLIATLRKDDNKL